MFKEEDVEKRMSKDSSCTNTLADSWEGGARTKTRKLGRELLLDIQYVARLRIPSKQQSTRERTNMPTVVLAKTWREDSNFSGHVWGHLIRLERRILPSKIFRSIFDFIWSRLYKHNSQWRASQRIQNRGGSQGLSEKVRLPAAERNGTNANNI